MKRGWWFVLAGVALVGAAAWRLAAPQDRAVTFRTEAVKRQDVRSTVTATDRKSVV